MSESTPEVKWRGVHEMSAAHKAPFLVEVSDEPTKGALQDRGADVGYWLAKASIAYSAPLNTRNLFGPYCPALLIPYFDLDGKPIIDSSTNQRFVRMRKLNKDHKCKYLSQRGTSLHAYLPPATDGFWRKVANEPDIPIVITEGEFKAGEAMLRLNANSPVPVIGIPGVDCLTHNGKLLPELAQFKWSGRKTILCWDAPIHDKLKKSLARAAAALILRGAQVVWVFLEHTPIYTGGGGKLGLDDYFHKGGDWTTLLDTSEPVDLGSVNPLLTEIAIVTGTTPISFVHLTGEHKGLLRNKANMADAMAPYQIDVPQNNSVKKIAAFPSWIGSKHRMELNKVVVRPDLPPLSPTPDGNFNSWGGMATVPRRNQKLSRKWWCFVRRFFSSAGINGTSWESPDVARLHRRAFIRWCAHVLQHPETRQHTSWTLIGPEGVGKSALGELIAHIIGVSGSRPGALVMEPDGMGSEWTDRMEGKTFIVYNEPSDGHSKMRGAAKAWRTNPNVRINNKYGACYDVENLINHFFTTNERFAFGIAEDARRDWVWHPSPAITATSAFKAAAAEFGRLVATDPDFRSAVMWDLLYLVDLSRYSPTEAAGNSAAKRRAAAASTAKTDLARGELLQEVIDAFDGKDCLWWGTESWMQFSNSADKKDARTDKVWLSAELAKMGLYAGSELIQRDGKTFRVWYVGKREWGSITTTMRDAGEWKMACKSSLSR